jgi:hypothetical protein
MAADHGGSMTRQRRILGMTTTQIGILIGLGAAACIMFAFTGWLAMRGGFQPAPAVTLVPQMTSTPFVLPTITVTVEPTPVPYEQLIPEGWTQHKTALVEIWLPSIFKVSNLDVNEELALTVANPKTSLYKMNVIVIYEPLGTNSLDDHIDSSFLQLEPLFRVVERRKVSLNETEAVRLVLEGRMDGTDVNELIYVIQDGSTAWAVLYIAQINEFYEMLPTFEQSAKTFRIIR